MRNRRNLGALLLVATLIFSSPAADLAQARAAPAGLPAASGPIEPGAGAWPTWVLASGSELRLAPPPGEAETQAELAELQALAARRDAAALDRISYWDAGAPPYRWTEQAIRHTQSRGLVGARAGRMLALMNAAIYDATVAAWDSKYAFNRTRPSEREPALATVIATPASPSYPDEWAVAAGAASTVLAYVFPADAAVFAAWAEEAAQSRLEAGVAYPSDVAAGLELGRQVGERAVALGRADNSDAVWTGSVPAEPGKWTGTNPIEPLGGSWKPWALASGDQFRPGPPPALDSEQMAREVAAVRDYPRTNLTNLTASFWEYYGGRAGFEYWNEQASRKIFEYRLDNNPPRAAQVYALADIAWLDASIACWDAKYTYWAPRPQMVDPTIAPVFVTPNHPSYPSAHSCLSGATGVVLGRLFPRDAAYFDTLTQQVGEARIMGGIHFQTDCDVGLALGRQVAEVVLARAGLANSP
jgi:membrane-associated phospholipid phosphatase